MNKVGRKVKLNEEEVKEIIYLFKTERGISGRIKYADIHAFAQGLVIQGKTVNETSESFWRKKDRLGRKMVDEANRLFAPSTISKSYTENNIPDVVKLINQNFESKENLIKSLIPVETMLKELIKIDVKLKKEKEEDSILLDTQIEKNKELQEQNEKLQSLVLELYRYISNESNENTKNLTTLAMNQLFNNPTKFIMNINKGKSDQFPQNNVVYLVEKNKKISDNFKGKLE